MKSKKERLVFASALIVLVFYLVASSSNVYHFAVGGAIFELLWLPFIILLLVLPILAFIFWVKQKFKLKSLHPFSILICIVAIMLLALRK